MNHWITKFIGLLAALMFSFFTIITFDTEQLIYTLGLAAFAGFGLFLFLVYGKTGMNDEIITHKSALGRFEIKWDEIQSVVADSQGNSIVFKGKGKQLVIPGRPFWSGKEKKQMVELFESQIEQRKISVTYSFSAAYSISRNTKLR